MARRPKTIWITQILLVIVGVPSCLLLLSSLLGVAVYFSGANVSLSLIAQFLLLLLLRAGLVALFAFAFWGLVKRKKYGRWLSVVIVLLIAVASILGQVFRPTGPLEYYEYENETQRMGGVFANVMIYSLIAFFLYRLIFGESVSDFFEETAVEEKTPPPPPPEFPRDV